MLKNIEIGDSDTNCASNNKGFTLIELLVVVAIIGVLAAVGVVAFNGFIKSAKENTVLSHHKNIEKWFSLKAVECEIEGKITYSSWRNRGTKEEKNCSYNNGWQLVMDLGYNHIRYHFLAEHDYENNFQNPFNPNDTLGNPEWLNGCSDILGKTSFYGNNVGEFLIWTNTGESECLESRIRFTIN